MQPEGELDINTDYLEQDIQYTRVLAENQYQPSGRPPQAKKFEGPSKSKTTDEWGNRKLKP